MRAFAQKQNQPQKQTSSILARSKTATLKPPGHTHPLHYTQRAAGNQAAQQSLPDGAQGLEAESSSSASPRFEHDFSRVPLHALGAASVQTKLSVSEPGDMYEREAEHVAEKVLRTPAPQTRRAPSLRQDAGLDAQHLQRTPIAKTVTPLIQTKGSEGATVRGAVASQIASSRGGGSPLPESSKSFMESRFGTDFSRVRVHTDTRAARLSESLNAKAFTLGRDIYFNEGNFSPESAEGRSLLAHELTHTLQQGALPGGGSEAQLMIQKKDGDKAKTAFGVFEAVKYHALKKTSDGKEVGVEMFMKFNPGPKVDAKLIALTQAATGKISGTSAASSDANFGRRSATAGAGQGQFIDVLPGFPSPLYSTADKPTTGADASKLPSYPTVPSTALTAAQITAQETSTGVEGHTRTGFGKHGFQYVEAGVKKGPESAELYDPPALGTANDSEQIFETTALAIEGAQKDTYYGSVTWGWQRDAAGKFTMIPFKAISQGTPTVNFLTAASIWNTATEDFNWGVSTATAAILNPADMSKSLATVTKGTALIWGGASGPFNGLTYNVVRVKDGGSKGTTGAIDSSSMAMMDVGRPTVDLPVTEIHVTNAASTQMVSDPTKAAGTHIRKFPKGTRMTILDATTNADWSKVKVADGPHINKEGWVEKKLLTREALGTH